MAEAANIPLAVSGPEILTETMARNEGVLKHRPGIDPLRFCDAGSRPA